MPALESVSVDGQEEVRDAISDFRCRSLAAIEGDLPKLIYIASMRDYNVGIYRHDGLTFRFSGSVVHQALSACHCEVFNRLLLLPLDALVNEVRAYIQQAEEPRACLSVWKELKPYYVTVPLGISKLAADLFMANLRIAVEALDADRPLG